MEALRGLQTCPRLQSYVIGLGFSPSLPQHGPYNILNVSGNPGLSFVELTVPPRLMRVTLGHAGECRRQGWKDEHLRGTCLLFGPSQSAQKLGALTSGGILCLWAPFLPPLSLFHFVGNKGPWASPRCG